MKAESLKCFNSPLHDVSITKLEPQSTLTVTQHMDDTQTQTTEHHSASQQEVVFFFLPYKPPCHKMMASTKSTVKAISLFVLLNM